MKFANETIRSNQDLRIRCYDCKKPIMDVQATWTERTADWDEDIIIHVPVCAECKNMPR